MTEAEETELEGSEYNLQGFRMFLTNKESLQNNLIKTGIHEWAETAIVPQFVRIGHTVVDVGANIGYYSLLLSRLAGPKGRVYAFEPLPVNYQRLCRNVELNCNNVTTVPLALGECRESARYQFQPSQSATTLPNLGEWTMLGTQSEDGNVSIETISLDEYVEEHNVPRINFMKIDVEGFELNVLKGATTVLSKQRPVLMLEFVCPEDRNDSSALRELADFMSSMRYTVCRIEKNPWPHIRNIVEEDFQLPVHFNAICYYGSHPVHM